MALRTQKIEKDKNMKNRLLTVASALKAHGFVAGGCALVVIVAGAFTAGPAIAQAVRAALVSNVDDPGRIPYQAQTFCSIAAGTNCELGLPNVPPGKRLVITNVSGYVQTNEPGGSLVLAYIQSAAGIIPLPTTFQGSVGASYFVFNQPVLGFYDAGTSPTVGVSVAAVGSSSVGRFRLSGYMLDCSTGPCAAIAP